MQTMGQGFRRGMYQALRASQEMLQVGCSILQLHAGRDQHIATSTEYSLQSIECVVPKTQYIVETAECEIQTAEHTVRTHMASPPDSCVEVSASTQSLSCPHHLYPTAQIYSYVHTFIHYTRFLP